ncbi:hypothetical protein VAR608DRAFT_0078 [Variovorax sp. HW608]|uniref:hypothetical protein n=1 Tax=Variovorax sp. HW608 TaxID=1034889 RepID=UPI00081FE1D7|nr:hypothetical protein [Variovorax sp. HW608]SCK06649.1 hypothetical protein VAR608DRAFT_0078 [Variovorax sp. HW608]
MSSINAVIPGRTNGHPLFIAHHAFVEFSHAAVTPAWLTEPSDPPLSSPVAFAGFIDLVRSTTAEERGEICEECKTLNRAGARYCKGCEHKLPAYYTNANARAPMVLRHRRERAGNRTLAWDLAAVWVVLSSLVLITAFIPVR